MTVQLDQLREQAKLAVASARQLDAEKVTTTISVGDEAFFLRVERKYRKEGRGAAVKRTLVSERVLIRERSSQGDVLYAAPAEWL